MPGNNAGYTAGRNLRQTCGVHFTVGHDSTAIGMRGYFTWLVGRDLYQGTKQFCEWDATAWHMCEFNKRGPGIEFEQMNWDEGKTQYMIDMGGLIIENLIQEGIPDLFTCDPPRVEPPHPGFLNHATAQLHACTNHTDGSTRDEWNQMRATASPIPPQEEENDMVFIVNCSGPVGATAATLALTPTSASWIKTDAQMRNSIALGQTVPANRGPMTKYGWSVGNVPQMPWNDVKSYDFVGTKPPGW